MLEARGLPVLDVDKLGYQALESEKEVIIARFGEQCLTPAGDLRLLDRRQLGKIVFENPEKLAALEAIIHPVVNRLTEDWINAQKGHCVINAALLHRSSAFSRLNRMILVKAPYLTRLLRARRRDRLSWKELIKRFASQKDFYTQYLSINAEIYIVENSGPRKLENQIDLFVKGIN